MISKERLRELKEALLFGDPLDYQQRMELVGVIEHLNALPHAQRGRPVNEELHQRAGVVGVLHEKHGVPLKAALYAAAPDVDLRERKSIERAYQRLRGTDVKVPERLARAALARLGR